MIKLALTTLAALSLATAQPAAQPAPALPAPEAIGAQVAGADDAGSAQQLPAGASQDQMPSTGDDAFRYYKLPPIQEGEHLALTAQLLVDPMLEPTSSGSIYFEAQLVKSDGSVCDSRSRVSTDRASMDRLALATLNTGTKKSDGFSGCYGNGNQDVFLKLSRSGTWQEQGTIPLQLNAIVEPAIDPTTLTGELPEQLPPLTVDVDSAPVPVSGGSGFATATTLEPVSNSSDAVLALETRYYKVHLSEGQRLNYRLTVGDSRDASASELVTQMYAPTLEDSVTEYGRIALDREDVGASVTRSTSSVVSRDFYDSASNRSGLRNPGDYYITVTGVARDPRGLTPLEYELAVQVTGEAASDAAWEPALAAEPNDDAPQADPPAAASSSWLPSSAQLGALLGGVAVALAGFAGLWILRRRKS